MQAKKRMPRAEFPNPQFERKNWLNLNGEWEFEIDNSVSGKERKLYEAESLSSRIIVPFCPESVLSGVNNVDFMNAVWYRKEIDKKGSGKVWKRQQEVEQSTKKSQLLKQKLRLLKQKKKEQEEHAMAENQDQ